MAEKFSHRHRNKQSSKELVYEDAPDKLRIGLWNLIQDYIKRDNLIDYCELYLKITYYFRLKRKQYLYTQKPEYYCLENLILRGLEWNEIYDLIEYIFTLVYYSEYDNFGNIYYSDDRESLGKIRYKYTKDINDLLSSEKIGWRLKKGRIERLVSEYLEDETLKKVRIILTKPEFQGPNNQFNKSIEFYSKRPKPDLENCIKEAVGALEGIARILLNDKKITLGKAINKLINIGKIRKPFDKVLHTIYGFASSEPGARHGAVQLSEIDIAEAECILYLSASCMLFICKKFNYKAIEHDELNDIDVPF